MLSENLFSSDKCCLFLTQTQTENAFEAVLNCNAYLEAILHIYMMLGNVKGLNHINYGMGGAIIARSIFFPKIHIF